MTLIQNDESGESCIERLAIRSYMVQISIVKRGMVTINVPYKRRRRFQSKKLLRRILILRDYNT
ncbi:hypothetical protein [Candidatus Enterovibrio luxaltus]